MEGIICLCLHSSPFSTSSSSLFLCLSQIHILFIHDFGLIFTLSLHHGNYVNTMHSQATQITIYFSY